MRLSRPFILVHWTFVTFGLYPIRILDSTDFEEDYDGVFKNNSL